MSTDPHRAGGRVRQVAPTRILLVGMMGCGKSTVGRALSDLTGWRYLDNDELVALSNAEPTPEVLHDHGEAWLRASESAALDEALQTPPPIIAGVAGGAVLSAENRSRLVAEPGLVVWLRATIPTLVRRVAGGAGRPFLQPDPATALERLYAGRAELYAEVADLVIDVDDLTPQAIADRVLDTLPPAG